MITIEDYTVYFDEFIGEITIPKGTRVTHNTAMGPDENYHFVADYSWYKKDLVGFARTMHMHDIHHRGIDVPLKYIQKS
jgi:hypothetical protein